MARKTITYLKDTNKDFNNVLDTFALNYNFPNALEISAATVTFGAAHYHAPMVITADCVVTLPAVAVGQAWWVICGADGVNITMSPASGDLWLYAIDGAPSADNKDVILASATSKKGDYIKFGFGDSTGFSIFETGGTWSDE
tara:strand:- start:11 stop:436 length:426 start_codon:yes stop_codon:yes gene_type:complete